MTWLKADQRSALHSCQVKTSQPSHGKTIGLCRLSIHVPHSLIRLLLSVEPDRDLCWGWWNRAGLQNLIDSRNQRCRHGQTDFWISILSLRCLLSLVGTIKRGKRGHTRRRIHLVCLTIAEDQEWVSRQCFTLQSIRCLQVCIDTGEVCGDLLRRRRLSRLVVVIFKFHQRTTLSFPGFHGWCNSWHGSWCSCWHGSWCSCWGRSAATTATTTTATVATTTAAASITAATTTARRPLRFQTLLQPHLFLHTGCCHGTLHNTMLATHTQLAHCDGLRLVDDILDRVRFHS